MKHVVWDWNGTLFDDVSIIVEATNATGKSRGWPVFDLPTYRREFERPLRNFYDKVNGAPVTDGEYEGIERDWHAAYIPLVQQARPNADTLTALDCVREAGAGQSILSMWTHDLLNELVDTLGMREYFVRVDGYCGGEPRKYPHLANHLQSLGLDPGPEVVYIGDSVDDVAAARQCGIEVVVACTGSHDDQQFCALDVAVASTLTEAVALAVALPDSR